MSKKRTSPAASGQLDQFMAGIVERNRGETEFHQAVEELARSVLPHIAAHPELEKAKILERMTEPDRVVSFRVTWEDDRGNVRVNRGWRVQFNKAIGPYKGGLRFHPSVNQSVLKFLGFEQCFKNALTGLPMGGAKGGSNFDPKGCSDREVMRFCQAFMTELVRHIGEDVDVPAGDIGVGAREIGFLFGQYARIANRWSGAMTGKGLSYGGSLIRKEATGYGCVYFADEMLTRVGDGLAGKTCLVSGSGNVAIYAIEKLVQKGAKVVSVSDSDGTVHDPNGFDDDRLAFLKDLKEARRGRIAEYAERFACEYRPGETPWSIAADAAFPCATQNELDGRDAKALIENGCRLVAEGANMPSTLEAIEHFRSAGVLFGPAKAANAGGVAVSGLEQSQNAVRLSWSSEEVDTRLRAIMTSIHDQCVRWGAQSDASVDYVVGANLAGFLKIADAMLAYGIV